MSLTPKLGKKWGLAKVAKYLLAFLCVIITIFVAQAIYFFIASSENSELQKSNLIVILPAATDRIRKGYRLAELGYAPNLAIIGVPKEEIVKDKRYHGFPSNVRRIATTESRSTFEDALNIRNIVHQYGFRSITLVTSAYHMPRAYFLTKIFLGGSKIDLQQYTVSAEKPCKSEDRFSPNCIKIWMNEMIKFWGSAFEMVTYQITGGSLDEYPLYVNFKRFATAHLLF